MDDSQNVSFNALQSLQHSSGQHPKLGRLPRPDLSQMIAYKPSTYDTGTMDHPLLRLLPEPLAQLILHGSSSLWQGPVLDIDQLLLLTNETVLPDNPPDSVSEKQDSAKAVTAPRKRRYTDFEEDEADDDQQQQQQQPSNVAPTMDLFRQRQAKKLSKHPGS